MRAARRRQRGQGMTEYIIIVALIAIAAIAVYGFFGDVIRGQVGGMAEELAGQDRTTKEATDSAAAGAGEQGKTEGTLENYAEPGS